jgi:hypothetical protein
MFLFSFIAFAVPFVCSRRTGKPFVEKPASLLQLAKQPGVHHAAPAIS